MNLMEALLSAKLGGSGGGSADVTAASVLAAMQAMTNTQEASARTAIAAQTAVVNVVTDFGAVGDGTTDDAAAIQSALDAGGVVYFPAKIYKIETALKFDSNMILLGEPGATILQGADINNLLRNKAGANDGGYTATRNVRIIGATFDGGAYATNNTLLAFCHAENIIVEGCAFVNGYGEWHDIEINSSRNITVKNCSFDASRRSTANPGEVIQIDALTSRAVYPWTDEGAVDSTPCLNITIEGCRFSGCNCPAVGHHNTVAPQGVAIRNSVISGTGVAAIALPYCAGLTVSGCTISGYGTAVSATTSLIGAEISSNAMTGGNGAGRAISVVGKKVSVHDNDIGSYLLGVYITALFGATAEDASLIYNNAMRDIAGITGYTTNKNDNGLTYSNIINGVFEAGALSATPATVSVSSVTPTITPEANTIYQCGELSSLTITNPPATGAWSVVFTSGATATVTTFPASILGLEDFAAEANTLYEINVLDNRAVIGSWAVSA